MAQVSAPPIATENASTRMTRQGIAVAWRDLFFWAMLLVALGVRLYGVTRLSLWLDEGLDLMQAQVSLGEMLQNQVVHLHPPLYNALLHYLLFVAPASIAGRLLSVTAGVISVGLVYGLGRTLHSVNAGRVAGLLAAVSPLAVYWSQEARPYALAACFVLASYLLFCLAVTQRTWPYWAGYAVATAAAAYTEYSAFPALVAPALVVFLLRRRDLWRPFLQAVGGAVALYLPYLVILVRSLQRVYGQGILTSETSAGLAGYWPVFDFTALSISYVYGPELAWLTWPALVAAILLAQLWAVGAGALALRRPAWRAALALGLLVIPPVAFFVAAQRIPSYGARQVLSAAFGLYLLVGVGVAASMTSRRRVVLVGVALVMLAALVPSIMGLNELHAKAEKQQWNVLAADLARGLRPGAAVVYMPVVAQTLVNAYFAPSRLGAKEYALERPTPEQVDKALTSELGHVNSVWLAYMDYPGLDATQQWLRQHGFVQVFNRYYPDPLGLQLYTRQVSPSGPNLILNGDFRALAGGEPANWSFSGPHQVDNGALVQVNATANPANDANQGFKLKPQTFYSLSFEHRNTLTPGQQQVFIIAMDAGGKWLDVIPGGSGLPLPAAENWTPGGLAFITPPGTVQGAVILRNSGVGKGWFRNVFLMQP